MIEIGLLGKKVGMTREFYKSGQSVPVTVVKMEKARVIQVIDQEKRGYKAVQLGFGKIKNSKLTKSMKGFFTKKNTIVFFDGLDVLLPTTPLFGTSSKLASIFSNLTLVAILSRP